MIRKYFLPTLIALLVSFLALVPNISQAQDLSKVDVTKLTPEQQAYVAKALAEQKNGTATSVTVPTPPANAVDVAKGWADLGRSVGTGVVSAAKEIGVAAQDFSRTDLGKITIAVLIYKYLGKDMIETFDYVKNLIGGLLLMVVGIPCFYMMVRKGQKLPEKVEYKEVPILWGAFTWRKQAVVSYRDSSRHDPAIALQIIGYLGMAFSFIVGATKFF